MKKSQKILLICFILILLKLLLTFTINQYFISQYNNYKYNESLVKKLFILNFPETYIAYYNFGNVLYNNSDYENAILNYEKALTKNPPKKKECSIRINLALAKLQKVNDKANKEENLKILYDARNTLCEKGCANENDDNGHSPTAEQLKKDIDKKIQELEKEQDEQNSNDNKDDKESEEESNSNDTPKNLEQKAKQLEQYLEQSTKERNSDLTQYEQSATYDYSYYGKTW